MIDLSISNKLFGECQVICTIPPAWCGVVDLIVAIFIIAAIFLLWKSMGGKGVEK